MALSPAHTHKRVSIYQHTVSHTQTHKHKRVSIYQHTLSHTQTHTHTHTHIHIHSHTHMYVYVCVCQRRKYTRAKGKTAPKKYNFAPDMTRRGAKSTEMLYSSKSTITLKKFYLSTSK